MRWSNGFLRRVATRFNVMFPYVPGGLEDFVDKVVPELQRRGSLSAANTRARRCEKISDLPRPENQFFKSPEDLSGERAEVAPALRPSDNH
jgi:hypothetical protein